MTLRTVGNWHHQLEYKPFYEMDNYDDIDESSETTGVDDSTTGVDDNRQIEPDERIADNASNTGVETVTEDDDGMTNEELANYYRDKYGPQNREGLRPRKQPTFQGSQEWEHVPTDYNMTQFATQPISQPIDYSFLQAGLKHLESTMLTQCSINKGLKVFGQAGADAVVSEMQQPHDFNRRQPDYKFR